MGKSYTITAKLSMKDYPKAKVAFILWNPSVNITAIHSLIKYTIKENLESECLYLNSIITEKFSGQVILDKLLPP